MFCSKKAKIAAATLFLALQGALVVDGSVQIRQSTDVAPPTKAGCHAHADHYDCDDGGWCEMNTAQTAWECFDAAGNLQNADGTPVTTGSSSNSTEEVSESSGGRCIVHGGHTHGDCSGLCDGIDTGEYDEGLHIASVFIMLVASAVGVFFPILFRKHSSNPVFSSFFFATKHFGTGVILCTALIHLLYHAFVMFNNSCVADKLHYEPVAPAVALAAIFLTFIIDYAMHRYIREHQVPKNSPEMTGKTQSISESETSTERPISARQEIVNVQMLEAGIIFHSIMIGVSLGATGGSEWVALLCAIVFHQMFEGLGLGTRIAELVWPTHDALRKVFMGVAFALITPIGVAIGIGVHKSYNPNSVSALASIGILDALSAGILLYTALVEMLAHDFIHGELKDASVLRAAAAFFFILIGALGMAVIGKWA
ncbi:hypothetical protein VNI00_006815 [Paramarasmius palmivorus]|uniref:Uncharacterized protein n=1 Tax=Paramarasmius palmivorus TaxID=297713 RepID=A0AAW0D7Y7_9AGAR